MGLVCDDIILLQKWRHLSLVQSDCTASPIGPIVVHLVICLKMTGSSVPQKVPQCFFCFLWKSPGLYQWSTYCLNVVPCKWSVMYPANYFVSCSFHVCRPLLLYYTFIEYYRKADHPPQKIHLVWNYHPPGETEYFGTTPPGKVLKVTHHTAWKQNCCHLWGWRGRVSLFGNGP